MRILFFAVLLSVMQAAPPIPRQSPDSTSQNPQKRETNTAKNPSPISPVAAPQGVTEKAASDKKAANNPTTPNTEQSVGIRELPQVSVQKDWMDKTTWIFSAILVVVGIGGVWAALKTLSAIERQAETMDHALRVDQRAWMGIANIKIKQFLEPKSDFIVEIEAIKTGKTPALRVVFHNRLQALVAAQQPNRTFGERNGHGTVMPDFKQIISIGENHPVSAETFEQVRDGVRTMYLHGRIEYQDIFGKPHWTNWCFRLVGRDLFVAHSEHNDTDDIQTAAV